MLELPANEELALSIDESRFEVGPEITVALIARCHLNDARRLFTPAGMAQ